MIPRAYVKRQAWQHIPILPGLRSLYWGYLGAGWSMRLVELLSSRFRKRHCLKNNRGQLKKTLDVNLWFLHAHTHRDTNTGTCVQKHTTWYASIHTLLLRNREYLYSNPGLWIVITWEVEHGIKCVNQKISRKGSLCIIQTQPRVSEGPKWMTKGEHTEEQWGQQRGLQTVSYQRDSKHHMFSTSISFLGSLRPMTDLNILLPTVPMANILCILSNTWR